MVIKKIFEKEFDEEVHSDFLKFGRGEFKDKYLVEGKKQKNKWAVKTSAEFANFLVQRCLEKAGNNEKIFVKGSIVSTGNLRQEINFEIVKVKNFQGIKQIVVNTETLPAEILELIEKYPRVFYALSFKKDDFILKIKAKPPKSRKAPSKGEEAKPDFCSLKTSDENLIRELFFDIGMNWKECKISHIIKVNEIIYPENVKELKPEEIREQSKKKGMLVRKINIDGREVVKETEFEV